MLIGLKRSRACAACRAGGSAPPAMSMPASRSCRSIWMRSGVALPSPMIGLVEGEQVEAVVGEQPQPRGQHRQFVEIEQQPEGAVAELMHARAAAADASPRRHRAPIGTSSLQLRDRRAARASRPSARCGRTRPAPSTAAAPRRAARRRRARPAGRPRESPRRNSAPQNQVLRLSLQRPEPPLRRHRGGIEDRMLVDLAVIAACRHAAAAAD